MRVCCSLFSELIHTQQEVKLFGPAFSSPAIWSVQLRAPNLLLNQDPSEPCYATGRKHFVLDIVMARLILLCLLLLCCHPVGRITCRARPSVRLSVCHVRTRILKTKKRRKIKIGNKNFPGYKEMECQFSDKKVRGQGHRTSKTFKAAWRHVYLRAADHHHHHHILFQ